MYPCRGGIGVKTASLILIPPGCAVTKADDPEPSGSRELWKPGSRREALRRAVSPDGYLEIFKMLPHHNVCPKQEKLG